MNLPLPQLPLRVWLLASYALVFVMPLAALLGTGALAWDLVNQTKEDLEHQGALIAMVASERIGDPTRMSEMLAAAKAQTLAGIRVTDDGGVVIASSGSGVGEDLSDDEEIRDALAGSRGLAIKPRPPGDRSSAAWRGPSRHANVRVFVAVPVKRGEEVVGAVILSRTPREEFQTFLAMAPRLSGGVLLALGLTGGMALLIGVRAGRSLKFLARASERIAAGDLADDEAFADAKQSRIAETAALASSMEAMARRLKARLAYISEFAGNVSHEFKTPVSALRGTVELLRDDEAMPAEQRARFLDNAMEDLDRLSRLVSGLLALARAEESAERTAFELDELAVAVAARHPGVGVEPGAAGVLASREQLESAVNNLVENALRYGAPPVGLRGWVEGERTGIDVEDAGPGIDPANVPRLFERFFTTDRARGGTGLGLALVKAVAEAHGGSVSVESRPGRTVFRVGLPRVG